MVKRAKLLVVRKETEIHVYGAFSAYMKTDVKGKVLYSNMVEEAQEYQRLVKAVKRAIARRAMP